MKSLQNFALQTKLRHQILDIPLNLFFSPYQTTMQQEIMMRTTVLTSGSGIPALYLNSMPRPTTAFRRDHQANAANPFWVCHK